MGFVTAARRRADLLQGLGQRPPVVLSHGWPLNSDSWEAQMLFLAEQRLPLHRPRPARPRPIHPDLARQRDGHLRRRPRRADRGARPARRHARRLLHRRRRGRPLHRPARHRPRRAGSCSSRAVPPFMLRDRRQPRRRADRGLRRHPGRLARRPLAALPRPRRRAVLRQQPARRERVAGHPRRVLAAGHAGRAPQRLRVHRGVLRHRLPRRPRRSRRADAGHPRRRRPGRAVRGRRQGLGGADRRRRAEGLPRRAARHHRHPQGPARRRPARVPQLDHAKGRPP